MEISRRQKEFELLLRNYFLMNNEQVAQIEELVSAQVFAQRAADYAAVEKELKDTLTVDVDAVEWVDESKKWKDGIEPCLECSNPEKIRTALAAIKQIYEQEEK